MILSFSQKNRFFWPNFTKNSIVVKINSENYKIIFFPVFQPQHGGKSEKNSRFRIFFSKKLGGGNLNFFGNFAIFHFKMAIILLLWGLEHQVWFRWKVDSASFKMIWYLLISVIWTANYGPSFIGEKCFPILKNLFKYLFYRDSHCHQQYATSKFPVPSNTQQVKYKQNTQPEKYQ